MAKLFSGMAKDNFLDSLVEKTGKNGHGLYDYLARLIDEDKRNAQEAEKPVKKIFTNIDRHEFSGSRKELIDLLKLHGADCYGISAVSSYGLCVYAARVLGVSGFIWYRPIQVKGKDGKIFYSVEIEEAFLDEKGNEIFTH